MQYETASRGAERQHPGGRVPEQPRGVFRNTGDFAAAARFGLSLVDPRELLRQLQEGQF